MVACKTCRHALARWFLTEFLREKGLDDEFKDFEKDIESGNGVL